MIGALRLDLPITDLDSLASTQLCSAPAVHLNIYKLAQIPLYCTLLNQDSMYFGLSYTQYVKFNVDRLDHRSPSCFDPFDFKICSINWNSRPIHLEFIISCVKCLFPPVASLNPSSERCTTFSTEVLTFRTEHPLKMSLLQKVTFCTALVQTAMGDLEPAGEGRF